MTFFSLSIFITIFCTYSNKNKNGLRKNAAYLYCNISKTLDATPELFRNILFSPQSVDKGIPSQGAATGYTVKKG
jgi:hypothetical protein